MLLAMKFGWSRAEILALSQAEMDFYVNRIVDLGKEDQA